MPKKVKKKEVKQCFTCPLCTNLFDRPTTISECLHTFCRSCIHDKFITERLKACPICNVDLGGAPLDKLRPDYSLEDMRLKLFPPKTESVKAGQKTVAASLKSSKKKEKSLAPLMSPSSIVSFSPDLNQDAPRVEPNVLLKEKLSEQGEDVPRVHTSAKPIITFKKREKKTKKNVSRVESEQPPKEAEVKKFPFDLNHEPDNELDEAEASTSQEVLAKERNSEKDHEAIQVSSNLCKFLSGADEEAAPLNINETLAVNVEPAVTSNGRETQDYVPISSGETEEAVEPSDNNCVVNKETAEEASGVKVKNNGKQKQESRNRSRKKVVEKSYSLRPRSGGRAMNPAASTPQVDISVETENKVEGRNNPVWFTLLASRNQNTVGMLPQISPRYLKVKNRNLTVSFVKKYLVHKLSLESEDQVEIWLRHEPVSSSKTLHTLVDWWVQTTPLPERKSAMVGSSGADFVMVLYYSLKATTELSGSE